MSKYILSPDGTVKRADGNSDVKAEVIARDVVKKSGSFYEEGERIGNVNLPIFSSGEQTERHIIKTEILENDESFLAKTTDTSGAGFAKTNVDSLLANPSFGTGKDTKISHYRNFNNYLDDKEIFASELEMISGVDLNTSAITDPTKYIFWIEYIAEAAVYIAMIEGILAAESLIINKLDKKNTTQIENDFQMEIGNYGAINYSALTRYIHEVLRYPKNKESKPGFSGTLDRIGAFYIGLSFYVNTDPLIFLDKFNATNNRGMLTGSSGLYGVATGMPILAPVASVEILQNIIFYLVESLVSLSGIGNNRLLMLIRKFNQKANWHETKLFNAKNNSSKDNFVEKPLVELNYYYVTFIIERMHVGLKLKKYYRNKKYKRNKLNRSGRLSDSRQSLNVLNYDYSNKAVSIDKYKPTSQILENKNNKRQSLSIAALPQAFIMPDSFIRSLGINNEDNYNKAFAEEHVRSYFLNTKKPQERLSPKVVAELESYYEKEMMPFYFQDLRTNEIIGFHAFIDSYTDAFSPQYNETQPGYGRVDKIQHYMNTTRTISMTFTLVSMSKEDHDLMWYQINKLVSMCYPQWSNGYKIKGDLNGREYPFTQVPTASPLIRIRLGDVLKSNYSEHTMEKIHGSGYKETNTPELDIEYFHYLLPGEYTQLKESFIENEKGIFHVNELVRINIVEYGATHSKVTYYEDGLISSLLNSIITLEVDNKSIVTYTNIATNIAEHPTTGLDNVIQGIANLFKFNEEKIKRKIKKSFKEFTAAYKDGNINNPLAAAQETTLGKGLAGFIKNLDIQNQEQLWEVSVEGSKAPMSVKISLTFDPIHDIAPGLDADGAMRAPVYNTGRIVNTLYGDVYDKDKIINRSN